MSKNEDEISKFTLIEVETLSKSLDAKALSFLFGPILSK
jgi:hypothetical protein